MMHLGFTNGLRRYAVLCWLLSLCGRLEVFPCVSAAFHHSQISRPWERKQRITVSVIVDRRRGRGGSKGAFRSTVGVDCIQRDESSSSSSPTSVSAVNNVEGADGPASSSPIEDDEHDEIETGFDNRGGNEESASRLFIAAGTASPTGRPVAAAAVESSFNVAKRVNGAPYKSAPTVASCLGPLLGLTRPVNFPGIVLFHMLGVFLAVRSAGQEGHYLFYWETLLRQPLMWVTLAALVLTSSTSMVVNDYYDAKLGRDVDKNKALVDGGVPLYVAKRFLNYLYAAALVAVAFLPGVPSRLSVLVGLMLTFWYTKHIKPVTWLKNTVCASLIALSPWTSAASALHVTGNVGFSRLLVFPSLWRLVGALFFGVLGREMIMDCNDVANDRIARVRTVPVVYGRRCASTIALCSAAIMSAFALGGPAWELVALASASSSKAAGGIALSPRALWSSLVSSPGPARRLVLGIIAVAMSLLRHFQVYATEGGDPRVVDRAVKEGLITSLFLLGSFV